MKRLLFLVALAAASLPAHADSDACLASLKADDAAGAITACGAAVQADPEDARSWAIRGMAQMAKGNTAEASTDLDRALGIDPALEMALLARSDLRIGNEDLAGAQVDLEAVLRTDKSHYGALMKLADLAWAQQQADEALAYLARAAKAQPDESEPWVSSAVVVHATDRRQALKYLDKAIKVSKTDFNAYQLRAHLRYEAEEWKDAIKDLRSAAELEPDDLNILLRLSRSLVKLGREDEAMQTLDAAVLRLPEASALKTERMELRRQRGDLFGAEADLRAASPSGWSRSNAAREIGQAIDDKYAPGLTQAEKRLATELNLSEKSCTASAEGRWMGALVDSGGSQADATKALARALQAEYVTCQDSRLPPPTEKFAEMRQAISGVTAAAAGQADALLADCAAYPGMASACAEYRSKHAARAGQLMSSLRDLEAAASKRRLEVAAAKATAIDTAAAAVHKARDAFRPRAAEHYRDEVNLEELREHIAFLRAHPVPSLSQRCPDPGVPSIHASEAIVKQYNERSNRYRDCLNSLESELERNDSDLYSAAIDLQDVRQATDALRSYRCSVTPGAGCVDDALWQSADKLATSAAVAQARSTSEAYEHLIETAIPAAFERINEAIAQRNRQLSDHEAGIQRQRMLETFADTLNQSMQGNQGGYGGRSGSSTSAPGIR